MIPVEYLIYPLVWVFTSLLMLGYCAERVRLNPAIPRGVRWAYLGMVLFGPVSGPITVGLYVGRFLFDEAGKLIGTILRG